jgi:hypothetical protein
METEGGGPCAIYTGTAGVRCARSGEEKERAAAADWVRWAACNVSAWRCRRLDASVRRPRPGGKDTLAAASPARRSTEKRGMSTTVACREMGGDGGVIVAETREPSGRARFVVQGHQRGRVRWPPWPCQCWRARSPQVVTAVCQRSPLASCASSAEREGRGLLSLCVLPKERGDGRGCLGR